MAVRRPGAQAAARCPVRALLTLLLTLAPVGVAAVPAEPDALEGMGRWERNLRRCRLEHNPPEELASPPRRRQLECRRMWLDQPLAGQLRVRFLVVAPAPDNRVSHLVLAGILEPSTRPMDCQQLRCHPRWPILLRVSALARSGNLSMLADPDPLRTQLAEGRCELDARVMHCEVRGRDGDEWRLEGEP
jgi:hypothetical protein